MRVVVVVVITLLLLLRCSWRPCCRRPLLPSISVLLLLLPSGARPPTSLLPSISVLLDLPPPSCAPFAPSPRPPSSTPFASSATSFADAAEEEEETDAKRLLPSILLLRRPPVAESTAVRARGLFDPRSSWRPPPTDRGVPPTDVLVLVVLPFWACPRVPPAPRLLALLAALCALLVAPCALDAMLRTILAAKLDVPRSPAELASATDAAEERVAADVKERPLVDARTRSADRFAVVRDKSILWRRVLAAARA